MRMSTFQDFGISDATLRALQDMGFEEPSPIQREAIPVILEGKDVIGQAQTGTGKTAAFGIPIVETVDPRVPHVQALILVPTRELAVQVSGEIRRIAKYKPLKVLPVYGGQSIVHQVRALRQGVHVVIGTPGRLLDHLERGTLDLSRVKILVLDEADEMLDMGFIEDIERILERLPRERQNLLFSATMPPPILALTRRYMRDPVTIRVTRDDKLTAPSITQVYYKVLERNKLEALARILDAEEIEQSIIFCRTKKGVDELTEALQARGYLADGIHGDLSQAQRERVMRDFRAGRIEHLIATDVAARGLDIPNVSHVINYDIPQDPESYVHRIGRTGRAGRSGVAITLVTPREMKQLRMIQEVTRVHIEPRDLPSAGEINLRRADAFLGEVEEAIASGEFHPVARDLAARLQERFSADALVPALVHLALRESLEEDVAHGYDFGETGAQEGMVRFFLNVGKNVQLTPKRLAEELAKLVGISESEIGRIDIFDRFSFVEVPEAVAPFVYEALQGGRLMGLRINVEPARPRQRS